MDPWRCGLCALQTDELRYPQTPLTDDMPKIHLRCGHEFHTHCYMYRTMATEELPTYERCPNDECGEFIFPETVREYYREEPGGRRADVNVLTLWNENKGFRDDLKVLLKLRREYRKNYRTLGPLRTAMRRRFAELIRPFREGILHEKEEHTRQLLGLPERQLAIRSMRRFKVALQRFLNKYDIWITNLRALRGIKGAPYIPARGNFGVKWSDRRSIQYEFRARI
jgi:hypothetical protein